MGAAEDQHIYPVLLHLLQICLGSQLCHLVVCPAFFCKVYKQRAWPCEYSNRLVNGFYGIKICPAFYSTFSAYYAYLFGLGYLNRPSCARFYYPNYWYWQFLLQAGQAVLQATTRSFILNFRRNLSFSKEYLVTVSADFVPYGTLAVSPR